MADGDNGGSDGAATAPPAGTAPLRIAALIKQVPLAEGLELGPDGRLQREGLALEMNPYCRRAVSKGVELAKATGGTCTVFTLGPPSAEDALREAVAWGADGGVHVCDPAFAGSDTLATARALAAALEREGPFDLVLVGRNSTDGDTGQVGPEVAELAGLPFACGARRLELADGWVRLDLELDDGWQEAEVALPALISVAERLCDPCKVPPEGRGKVAADRLRRLSSADLGDGPWGQAGSPTVVGSVRVLHHEREGRMLAGPLADQVDEAVRVLVERGALVAGALPDDGVAELEEEAARSAASAVAAPIGGGDRPVVAAVLEPGRPQVDAELLGAAARLAAEVGGEAVAVRMVTANGDDRSDEPGDIEQLSALGADAVVDLVGEPVAEDVAAALTAWWSDGPAPWTVLAPGTAFGREVAARVAAALGAGLVGDAIGVDVVDGRLVAAKPAFSGALVADITCTSPVQLVTLRPGVLSVPPARPTAAVPHSTRPLQPRNRVRLQPARRDDDVEVLARAEVVIGVGAGVQPDEYSDLSGLAAVLGAEMAATRKVTDKGWAPRARQVGITGRSIAPRLYVGVAVSGKFNHMVGVRSAGTVLAVNSDPGAPVFGHADVGIVGDWHDVVPLLQDALRQVGAAPALVADPGH